MAKATCSLAGYKGKGVIFPLRQEELMYLLVLLFLCRDWVGVQCTGYKIEKNARVEVIDLSTK